MLMMQAPAQALPTAKTDAVSSSAVTLATKNKGHKGGGGGKHHHKGHHGFRKFRGFGFYGYPYFYGYSSFGRCDWLYRRAIRAGSPYWWDRYYACRNGYYDY
jgi:hypothetical protein